MNAVIEEATSTGYVTTLLGRRRAVPDIHSPNKNLRNAAERVARNTPIQGTAADIIKIAMVEIQRAIEKQRLRSRMVLTVHDELVFEVPPEEREALGGRARADGGGHRLDVPSWSRWVGAELGRRPLTRASPLRGSPVSVTVSGRALGGLVAVGAGAPGRRRHGVADAPHHPRGQLSVVRAQAAVLPKRSFHAAPGHRAREGAVDPDPSITTSRRGSRSRCLGFMGMPRFRLTRKASPETLMAAKSRTHDADLRVQALARNAAKLRPTGFARRVAKNEPRWMTTCIFSQRECGRELTESGPMLMFWTVVPTG